MVAATTLIGSAEPAFERLFVEEYGRVVSVAYRITRDAAEAEDVAQEVFVRFARSTRPDFTRAGAWLYRAAVHGALNAVRSRKRRLAREQRQFRLQQSLDDSAQKDADPQTLLDRNADTASLRAATLRLRTRDAEILALRYGGLAYAEISSVIGVDVRQIGTRLARAEQALKRILEIERETSR